MKIKTSELTGDGLRWAVMQAEGDNSFAAAFYYADDGVTPLCVDDQADVPCTWEPDMFWSQGGPIIEREKIDLCWDATDTYVIATQYLETEYASQAGPTPLIAAMRCYVASKLGDVVDVPDELCEEMK